jgi:hypothetical protein
MRACPRAVSRLMTHRPKIAQRTPSRSLRDRPARPLGDAPAPRSCARSHATPAPKIARSCSRVDGEFGHRRAIRLSDRLASRQARWSRRRGPTAGRHRERPSERSDAPGCQEYPRSGHGARLPTRAAGPAAPGDAPPCRQIRPRIRAKHLLPYVLRTVPEHSARNMHTTQCDGHAAHHTKRKEGAAPPGLRRAIQCSCCAPGPSFAPSTRPSLAEVGPNAPRGRSSPSRSNPSRPASNPSRSKLRRDFRRNYEP